MQYNIGLELQDIERILISQDFQENKLTADAAIDLLTRHKIQHSTTVQILNTLHFLCTLDTSDIRYDTETCYLQGLCGCERLRGWRCVTVLLGSGQVCGQLWAEPPAAGRQEIQEFCFSLWWWHRSENTRAPARKANRTGPRSVALHRERPESTRCPVLVLSFNICRHAMNALWVCGAQHHFPHRGLFGPKPEAGWHQHTQQTDSEGWLSRGGWNWMLCNVLAEKWRLSGPNLYTVF